MDEANASSATVETSETSKSKPPASPQPSAIVSPFTKGLPDDPALNALVSAFEQGRYDVVRDGAAQLAKSSENPEVASAAMALRSRLDADPLAVRLMIVTFILLAVLITWVYFGHHH